MKTFGVVGEENKKSTRKKMPKIRLTLFIICHRYFDTIFFQLWVARLFILFTKTAKPSPPPGINWLSPKQTRK
jgi:hypothetical protein